MDPELIKQHSNLTLNEDELAKQQEELKKLEQELEESKSFFILYPMSYTHLCLASGKEEDGELVSNEGASQTGDAGNDPDERSVFVKNVDYGADEAQLSEHFKLCGDIVRVTIRKDHRTS